MEEEIVNIFQNSIMNFSKKIGEKYNKNHLNIFFIHIFKEKVDNIEELDEFYYVIKDENGNSYAKINKKTKNIEIF